MSITVGEYGKQWLETHPREKASTQASYAGTVAWINRDYGPIWGFDGTPGRSGWGIKTAYLTAVCGNRRWARAFAQAYPSRVGCVSAMFTDAMNDGLISSNPFHKLGLKRKRGRKDILPMNHAEISELLVNPRFTKGLSLHEQRVWVALLAMLAYTGIRPSEAFGLKWRDVDIYKNEVTIRRAYVDGHIGPPKNGQVRTVVLPKLASRHLRGVPLRDDNEWVFPTPTWKPYTKANAHPVWDKIRRRHVKKRRASDAERQDALAEARGKPLPDLYELRHYCATYLLDQGVSPEDVAHQLGHTDGGRLVISTYGHPNEQKIRDRIRQGFDNGDDD